MIGEVGVFIPTVDAHTGDVGWSLKKSHQGRGYALEATRALLGYAFLRRNLHRITAGCVASNAASLRLMNRLGMRCEGVALESRLQAGEWITEHKYALLRREWLAECKTGK